MTRIKKLICLFFIPIVLLGSMSFPLVYLDFQINKDYIVSNLCVNRTKPITVCGGSCYLQKKLTKDQSAKATSGESSKRLSIALFFQPVKKVFIPKMETGLSHSFLLPIYAFAYHKGVFHPPNSYKA